MDRILVVTDLDGVLIEDGNVINTSYADLLSRLHGQGVTWTVATGRSMYSVKLALNALQPTASLLVVEDGALVRPWDGDPVQELSLTEAEVAQVTEDTHVHAKWIVASTSAGGAYRFLLGPDVDQGYLESLWPTRFVQEISYSTDEFLNRLQGAAVLRLQVYTKELERTFPQLTGMTATRMERTPDFTGYQYTHQLVNKGTGITSLQTELSVAAEQIIVLGDGLNDVPMFEASLAAKRISVGPKCPTELREKATHYAPTPADAAKVLTEVLNTF